MTFMVVQESVTPKDAVNLRTMPTTTDDRNIVVKIRNGEALSRTGINNDDHVENLPAVLHPGPPKVRAEACAVGLRHQQ